VIDEHAEEPTHDADAGPLPKAAQAVCGGIVADCWRCRSAQRMEASVLMPGTYYCARCGFASRPPSQSLR
jgi:late competence protein required for DNA uptake (superfamily II DNA/RNA helicase)